MTIDEMKAVLCECYTPNGIFVLAGTTCPYLQLVGKHGNGRKWRLSVHMVASELVRTAFAAALAYEEHELREGFMYRGARVFSPHLDVEALVEIAGREDRRRGEPGAWEREQPAAQVEPPPVAG